MKSISDAWQLYRDHQLAAFESEQAMRVLVEVERAFYAGAECVVDELQNQNDAGLTFPFHLQRQLALWESETNLHHVGER